MRHLILIAVAGCVVGAQAVRAAPMLSNGNFESGDLSGWTATGHVIATPNTAYHSASGATGDTGTGIVASFGAGDGSGGVLSQTIDTVAGQSYVLAFQYGAVGSNPAVQEIRVTAGNLDQTVVSAPSANNLSTALVPYVYSFTAQAPTTTISFADVSPTTNSVDGLLDNVAVPEPASLSLLGVGLLGLAALRRRRA